MEHTTEHLEADDRGILLSCPNCGRRNRAIYENLGASFRCGNCHTEFPPISEPVEVTSESVFTSLTNRSRLPVLVDFWAPWCGPCKMVAPELVKVASSGGGRWLVVKVNTEELGGLAQHFQVSAIPLMVLFKAGRELARQAGALPAPSIQEFLNSHL